MREYEAITLPTGYSLDLVGDPCVRTLCRSDGTVVAHFTHVSDLEEIKRAAQEDSAGGDVGASIHRST